MDDRTLICSRCGTILKQTGTDQNGKYKKCNNCKVVTSNSNPSS